MTGGGPKIAAFALAVLALGLLFQGPIRARCCTPEPEPGQRVSALLWADRGGVPMLDARGREGRFAYSDLNDIRHGPCQRRIDTLTVWQTGPRGNLPLPAARITWYCLVTARSPVGGEGRLRGVIRLVDDPTAPWAPRDMLAGPDLPARLAALERRP